jgi:phytoene dehydrogenase-like protein
MKKYDVVVVGAGFSGLLSALALSKEGNSVLVIEKDNFIGGVCRSYNVGGYTVDTGPHAITRMESGPLKQLMDEYFDIVPNFVPFGKYHVRMGNKVRPFPWSIKKWLTFDILPVEDRMLLMRSVFDVLYMLSIGKNLSDISIEDLTPQNLSQESKHFLDYLSYFMLGTSPINAPISRFIDTKSHKIDSRSAPYVGRLYNLLMGNGSSDQLYPKGGIQKVIDSIIMSLPKNNVEIKTSEKVIEIEDHKTIKIIITDQCEYECDTVIYSGPSSKLPDIIKNNKDYMSEDYIQNLRNIKTVKSLCIWLGLKKKLFNGYGSEMWVSLDPDSNPYTWVVPTSNYDANLAPIGKQLVGFAYIVPDGRSIADMRIKALDSIFNTLPEMEENVEMIHYQELVPEKACWSLNSGFGNVQTPIENFYCVGSDSEKRSMGLTRSAYSVLRCLEIMKSV